MPVATDVAAVVARCVKILGQPGQWSAPVGYPDSLALCVLDAVWSIGVRYSGVENVVAAYAAMRRGEGAEPLRHNVEDLAAAVRRVGGPEVLASVVRNHQRTSTRGGVLKATAVLSGCGSLAASGLSKAAAVRVASSHAITGAEMAWRVCRDSRRALGLFAVPQARKAADPTVATTIRVTDTQLEVLDALAREHGTDRPRILATVTRLYLGQ